MEQGVEALSARCALLVIAVFAAARVRRDGCFGSSCLVRGADQAHGPTLHSYHRQHISPEKTKRAKQQPNTKTHFFGEKKSVRERRSGVYPKGDGGNLHFFPKVL